MSSDVAKAVIGYLESFKDTELKIKAINELKSLIHQHSPFCHEPVDCVLWAKAKAVEENDYNPNMMATVEKKLLKRSMELDGFTQPVVARQQQRFLIVNGFHRHLIGKNSPELNYRLHSYLPVTVINAEREDQKDRIAATIRHNRARGKHQIAELSDIIRDLHRQGGDDRRIGKELGMYADEVLRLKQISGLTKLFADESFSEAWTVK